MEKIYKNKMISKNKHYSIIEKNNRIMDDEEEVNEEEKLLFIFLQLYPNFH